MSETDGEPEGHPLAFDPTAESTTPKLPGFLARPSGAPVYHGFPVLDDVEVDGFRLGMISNWEAEPTMRSGDAFVVAPDNSRCGLTWIVSPTPKFREVLAVERSRWGVWNVGFPREMTSRQNARDNLAAILPNLREIWEAWRQEFS